MARGLSLGARARWALAASVALTVLVYTVPYGEFLGWPLLLLSTLAHELGHGVAAVAVGGRFDSFVMYADASGVAQCASPGGRVANAFISAGGLIGPAVVAALCFGAGRGPRAARFALAGLGVFLAVAFVLVVRNPFGWIFVGLVASGLLVVAWRDWAPQLVLVFLGVQLALSVFSRSDYLFADVARTGSGTMPSDVAQMANALWLPYWFWGAVCGAVSVAVLAVGLWSLVRPAGTARLSPRAR